MRRLEAMCGKAMKRKQKGSLRFLVPLIASLDVLLFSGVPQSFSSLSLSPQVPYTRSVCQHPALSSLLLFTAIWL